MRSSINPVKEALRAKIACDVDAFLSKQGHINAVALGVSGQDAMTPKRLSEFTINKSVSTGVKTKPIKPETVTSCLTLSGKKCRGCPDCKSLPVGDDATNKALRLELENKNG